MSDATSIAISGLNAGAARFEASARRMVQQPQGDLTTELVTQKLAAAAFKANIAVLKAADDMTKAALDILA